MHGYRTFSHRIYPYNLFNLCRVTSCITTDEIGIKSELSEIKQKLILKSIELEEANKLLTELTRIVASSGRDLKTAEDALELSDSKLTARSAELQTTEDALELSDNKLGAANRQLAETVKELAIANETLKLQDKMQREFINIAAHELRTPIQPIIAIIEMIEYSLDKGQYVATKDDIEILKRSANRLQRTAEDILDVARIEGEMFKMVKEPLDLGELVATAVKDHQIVANKSNSQLIYLGGKKIIVSADPNKINQVVSNLLDNAFKFSPNGTITVSVGRDDKLGIVEVTDTGGGISNDVLPKLFKKFAVKSEKGTGLGLYISKTIVEAHGGSITGQNNEEKGATFRFTVPLDTNPSKSS